MGYDWRERSDCKSKLPTWWDLTGTAKGPKTAAALTDDNRRAMWICAACPVAQACFDEALEHRIHGSIRGGIALWEPMERYRCARCRKVGIRGIRADQRLARRRRYCDGCAILARSAAIRAAWETEAA